jgi:hypothetical protein
MCRKVHVQGCVKKRQPLSISQNHVTFNITRFSL